MAGVAVPGSVVPGGAIAHVLTHSMHHRAQLLHMLRQLGMSGLPEGDVLSWERGIAGRASGVSPLVLRRPTAADEAEVLRAYRATSDVPTFLHDYNDGMPFGQYLCVLDDQDQGIDLPLPEHVPATFLFAFVDDRIVGRVAIRHYWIDLI